MFDSPNVAEITLSNWQDELLRDTYHDELIVTAGYGTGKTLAACLWVLDRLAYNPGCDALFVEPQWSLIKRVAIPAFEEAFTMLGYSPKTHYKVFTSTQDCRIELITGQKIMFLSGEKPENIIGISTCAIAVLDEAALMDREVKEKVQSRLRYKKAKKIQILLTTTPEGDNWVSEAYDSDTLDGWKELTSPKDKATTRKVRMPDGSVIFRHIRRLRATTFSNAHNLDASYIAGLLDTYKHNQNYIESYVYGYFRPFATGLAYSNYKSQYHRVGAIQANPDKPLHLTWDFNIEPQWVSIQEQSEFDGWQNRSKYWAALHNANEGHDNLEDACIEFMSKHPRNIFSRTPILIHGDPTGYHRSHKARLADFTQIKKTLNSLGYKNVSIIAIKSAPLERVSVDYVQQQLAENTFRITSNCDKVLKSITRTTWKNNEKGKLDKPPGETWTHPMDAVKYFFCTIAQSANRHLLTGRA